MSQAARHAVHACKAKNGCKLVMLVMAEFVRPQQDICWVDEASLASRCSMSVRQVRRCINKCIEDNYLEITQPNQWANGVRTARHFRLKLPDILGKVTGHFGQDEEIATESAGQKCPPKYIGEIDEMNVAPEAPAQAALQPSLPKRRKAAAAKKAPHPILRPDLEDQDWFLHLGTLSQFSHIDIGAEYGRCNVWCRNKAVGPPSRRRFINWLGRVEKPLSAPAPRIAKRNSSDDHYDRLGKLMEAANAQEYAMAGGAA